MEHRSVEEQLTGLRDAVAVFADHAAAAGLDAAVPTCPRWTTRTLLAHQGMVHRWAAANLRGEESHPPGWNAEAGASLIPSRGCNDRRRGHRFSRVPADVARPGEGEVELSARVERVTRIELA